MDSTDEQRPAGSEARRDPADPAFALEDYPFFVMAHTSALYNATLAQALAPLEMDQPRWRVLMLLGFKTPSTMSELAQGAVIKQSTLTRIVRRMAEEGLVQAAPRPSDARVTEVAMTDKGRRALGRIQRVLSGVYAQAVRGLSRAEIDRLNATLKHMQANLRRSPYDLAELDEAV